MTETDGSALPNEGWSAWLKSIRAAEVNPARKRRVALLVESGGDAGGIRVICHVLRALSVDPRNDVHVFVLTRHKARLRDYPGQARDVIWWRRRRRAAATVTLLRRPLTVDEFDAVISTTRRTLEFVDKPRHLAHVHLFQHIEAWDSLNSVRFREFCSEVHYPTPAESIELIREIDLAADTHYLGMLAQVQRIWTVSSYLKGVIDYLAPDKDVIVCEPSPHIWPSCQTAGGRRDIDLLAFARGKPFKGDSLSMAVVGSFSGTRYRIAVVARRATAGLLETVIDAHRLEIRKEPSDHALADLFRRARIVLHPSLCEGFGSIPQEALSFGCRTVASRTGWLHDRTSQGDLMVVDVHDPARYRSEIERLLSTGEPDPQRLSRGSIDAGVSQSD